MKQLSLLLICLLTGMAQATPIPEFPFIVASSSVDREVAPNKVIVSFTVTNHQPKAEDAAKQVDAILRRTLAALGELGVKASEITADDLEKNAVRRQDKDRNRLDIIGYTVSRDLELELASLEKYPEIARHLFQADGVTSVRSLFGHTDEEKIQLALLTEACAKARHQAEMMAKAAGVVLGKVHAVSDSPWAGMASQFGLGGHYHEGGRLQMSAGDPFLGSDNVPVLFVPKEISFKNEARLLFRLVE